MKNIAILAASIFIVFSGFFIKPAPFAHAQGAPAQGAGLEVDTNIENAISGDCGASSAFSGPCALYIFYVAIVEPSFYLVGVAAKILDFFLGYSLDSNAYRGDFVEKGWALIRDISNVAFIFTLLYLAIKHILGDSAKRAIPTLIIVALLLNFSLFFTKIIIDAGNILARAFYNSIVIENDQTYQGNENYKSITFGIVDKINPQNLFSEAIFSVGGNVTGDFNTADNQYQGTVTPVIRDKTGTIFAIFIMMIIVNGFLLWTFLSVALVFVGRVIGLWFMMIFSPIAFITLAVPGSGGFLKQLSFDSWKDTVLKLAFVAPVFIFFLYLTISFLSILGTGNDLVPSESTDMFIGFMKIFIPFIFIIVLLQAAKKTAESMAGEFGSAVKSIVGKAMGMVAGATLGVTAFAGRKVVGGLASSALKSGDYNARIAAAREKLKDKDLNGMQKARLRADLAALTTTKNALKTAKKSSFDIRNADKSKMLWGGVGAAAGFAGKNIIKPTSTAFAGDKMSFGKGSDQSREKFEKAQQKKILEEAEDQSSLSFREKRRLLQDKELATEEIKAINQSREELSKNFDEQTKVIQERLDELILKPTLTRQERDEMSVLEKRIDKEIPEEKKRALEDFDTSKKDELEKAKARADFDVKTEEKRRKNLVADSVESRDIWGMMMGVDNKEFADDIRSGKASKSDAEKLLEAAQKAVKPKDDEEKPKASTGGGAGTP